MDGAGHENYFIAVAHGMIHRVGDENQKEGLSVYIPLGSVEQILCDEVLCFEIDGARENRLNFEVLKVK